MYTFSKQSWHVKLFKWIFDTDPTRTYKSMCPYFWTYVLIILLFPFILVVKMFGIYGTRLLNTLRTYKEDKREKEINKFIARFNESLTDEQILQLVDTKCWNDFRYYLDWDFKEELERRYYQLLYARQAKSKQFREEIKQSKIFNFISVIIGVSAITSVIGVLIYLLTLVPWVAFGLFTIKLLALACIAAIFIGIIVLLINYVVLPIFNKIKCMECKLCKLPILSTIGIGFSFIFSGFSMVGNMIYVTYKKNCPLITWQE